MVNPTDFTQYELDRDIPDKIWNNYLRQYTKRFKVVLGDDRIWHIKCRFGLVVPYSLLKGYLLFVGKFPSPNKKTFFLKKLKGFDYQTTQNAYEEVSIKFKESSLTSLCDIIELRKRKNLSPAERERRRQCMLRILQNARRNNNTLKRD